MISGIIFDKDGTLFDFRATWTAPFRGLIEELASEGQEAAAAECLGFDRETGAFRQDSMVIASTSGEIAWALSRVLGREPIDILKMLDRIGAAARQVPAVPLRPCLAALQGIGQLGLVTNDSEESARRHLEDADVIDLFAFVAGFDSGFGAKPEPGQLLAYCEAVGLAPETVVMVGDSRHDLHAARAAGMVPVGVLTGVAGSSELSDLAEIVLPDIGHLAGWIAARR